MTGAVPLGGGVEHTPDHDAPFNIVPTRWDSTRAKKKAEATARDRTCLWCRKPAAPRYMYCSDACSKASRAAKAAK